MINRIKEIESRLTAFSKEKYLKKEIIGELFKIQEEVVATTFDSEHAGNGQLRLWDVSKHLEQMNESCGHVADELLAKFEIGSRTISDMIKADISGAKGESKAYKSLQTVRRSNRVLKNVELTLDEHRNEIDFICVTNNVLFLIEVKNTARDIVIDDRGNYCRVRPDGELSFDKNIGESMNEKEYLLREVLRRAGFEDVKIVSLVVFTNSNVKVTNNYPYIQECFLSQLPHIIDDYSSTTVYSDKQMMKFTQVILDAQCQEAYPIEMDMGEFKTTFATLLATLEDARAKQIEDELTKSNKKSFFAKLFQQLSKVACFVFH